MRAVRRLAALVVAATAGLTASAIAPWSAVADPGSCTPTSGVVVVVDFSPFGGSVQRGCAASPGTGFTALHAAGFSTAGTSHDGPGFVCRIDNLPAAAAEKCVLTPRATAYWSYWHADAGQNRWSYSTLGALSYIPKPGSVDAWAFGSGSPPDVLPSTVRATAPAPAPPTTAPRSTPEPPAPRTTPAPSATTPASGQPNASTPRSVPAGEPSSIASSTARPSSTASPSSPRSPSPGRRSSPSAAATASAPPSVVDVSADARLPDGSSNSLIPFLAGGAVILLLGAAAGWTAWRRRGM